MSAPNSVDRIIAMLDVFSEDRLEWTPEQLMAKLGYSRPTLYRYLKSLREAGFLASVPGGGFTLGPRVVEMDFLMRKSDRLVRFGQVHLDALVASFPCSALLVRWYGEKLLCVASEVSVENPVTSYPRGRPMPLSRGAISRAIMAFLPKRKLNRIVSGQLDDLRGIGLGPDVSDIFDVLRQIRRDGVAEAHGEVTPGVIGIAAPVFEGAAMPIAALSVTISASVTTPERISAIRDRVRSAANALSAELGERRERDDTTDTGLRLVNTG
ncbi:MAG: IclR family transcriptional regulator [Rhodobacteraceae bacterium]|nr:IclR family transcriptional regulator [Paracoccaceae bacterium]